MTVTRRIRRRGERGISRKTIARGMPGLLRCTCGDDARVLYLNSHARLRVHWAPGIPCALVSLGETVHAKLGRIAPRGRETMSVSRHCEERLVRRSSTSEGGSDQAIHSFFARRDGLLRLRSQ